MVVGPLTVKRPIGTFKNTVAYHHNELYHHPAQNVVICGHSVTEAPEIILRIKKGFDLSNY